MNGTSESLRNERKKTAGWRWIVGVILVVLLVRVAGPHELLSTLLGLSPIWAFLTMIVAALWLFVGALNAWLLLRCLARVDLLTFFSVYIASWAASNVSPGQLGDALQIVLLRRHGIPAAASAAAYFVDKVISLVWMMMVAAFGVALYTASVKGWWLLVVPAAVAVGSLTAFSLLRRLPRSVRGVARLQDFADGLTGQLAALRRHPRRIALNATLTVTKWAIVGTKYYCAFLAFGKLIPFSAASTIPVASSLVGYIPVTVGGIGTTEWTAVALFERAGVEAEVVVGVYLFLRVLLLLLAFFIHSLLHFIDPAYKLSGAEPRGKSPVC